MKKYLFFNSYSFLLAVTAMFLFASCTVQKTEKEIRAQVELEIMLEIDSLLQTPKNILSESDTRLVLNELEKTKVQVGVKTPVYRFEDGRQVSFFIDNDLNYEILVAFDGTELPALSMAPIQLKYDALVLKYLKNWIPKIEFPYEEKCYPFFKIESCDNEKCINDYIAQGYPAGVAQMKCRCRNAIVKTERCFLSKK